MHKLGIVIRLFIVRFKNCSFALTQAKNILVGSPDGTVTVTVEVRAKKQYPILSYPMTKRKEMMIEIKI